MSISVSAASKWPSRCAFLAAAIFIGASGAININFGWYKGTDLPSCLTWAAVAGGVACLFALSWPALIRSCEAKRWSAAAMALAALVLSGTYSVTAALGSAAGGRVQAQRTETATTGARDRAQARYEAAQAELAALKSSRPVGELEALIAGARPVCRVTVTSRRRQTTCAAPASLVAELGRARHRAELEKTLTTLSETLGAAPPPVANSDAAALSRYLRAVGIDIGQDRLNDLLVLLSVLMVEAGGGLALATGMALSGAAATRRVEVVDALPLEPGHQERQPVAKFEALDARPDIRTVRPSSVRPLAVQPSGVQAWLAEQGGHATTSMRRLASVLGRSPSAVHDELRRLAASGAITLASGPRGTKIALRPN